VEDGAAAVPAGEAVAAGEAGELAGAPVAVPPVAVAIVAVAVVAAAVVGSADRGG
jgi:hypothetical protein